MGMSGELKWREKGIRAERHMSRQACQGRSEVRAITAAVS